jgi:hypothetical protein
LVELLPALFVPQTRTCSVFCEYYTRARAFFMCLYIYIYIYI